MGKQQSQEGHTKELAQLTEEKLQFKQTAMLSLMENESASKRIQGVNFIEEFANPDEAIVKALADRLAEAFAERMHEHVRKNLWGYAPDENLDNKALIQEKYQGIRPAPGYPACPDHSLKPILFDMLEATENTGIELTSSFAMTPTAAVSGFYFAHPQADYFGVARISEDQVTEYAERRDVPLDKARQWLRPNLNE